VLAPGSLVVPLLAGLETDPAALAREQAAPIKELPYGHIAYPIIAILLGVFYTARRGARIRKGVPMSARPATGYVGERLPIIEQVLQQLVNVSTGFFTLIGKQSEGTQRAWKIIGSVLLAGLSAAALSPALKQWLAEHWLTTGMLAAIAGFFGAVNVELNKIKPVAGPKPPAA